MKLWLFPLLMLYTSVVLSNELSIFNQKWAYSPLIKRTLGTSVHETKVFKRFIWGEGLPIAINETVVTIISGTKEKTNLADLTQKIQLAFGKKLKVTQNGKSVRMRGSFSKINRNVDFTLRQNGDSFLVITSFSRSGFYGALETEVEELHQIVGKYFSQQKTVFFQKVWRNVSQLIIDEAYAQSYFTNPSDILAGQNDITGALNNNATQLTETNSQLNTMNGNWNETNQHLEGLNTNISNLNNTSNVQGQQLNNNLSNLNTTSNVQGQQFNNNLSNINNTVNSQGQQFNDNWAESNRLLAKTLEPGHMGKVAFYTAAGATLGALSVNLAIQGVSSGMQFLWEFFTETKKKEVEWEQFQKAMDTWDTQLNDLVQMELIVDKFIQAFNFFQNSKLGTNYPKIITTSIRDMSFDKEMFMEKFHDNSLNRECRASYFNAAIELDDKINEYKKILELAKGSPVSSDNPEAYFCGQLKELMRKILAAEQSMQDLRLKILVAERQFYDKATDTFEWRADSGEKVEDQLGKSLREQKQNKKKLLAATEDKKEDQRNEWIASCMNAKNPEGKRITEENKEFFSYFTRKRLCKEAYRPSSDVTVRDTSSTEAEIRKKLSISNNDFVDLNLNSQQEQWFTKIHMDAYCYQFAHRPETELPAKCKLFPETLYSLALARGYNKAEEAYGQSCSEKYQDGLSKILMID